MNFSSIKFFAQTEAESNLAQKHFFDLGYKWADTQNQVQMKWSRECWYSGFADGDLCRDDCDVNHHHRLVTLTELADMSILHRNDVNDANYSLTVASDRLDHPIFKSSIGIFHTYSDNNGEWIECKSINDKTTGLKALPVREALSVETTQTIKVKGLENLIEGPAALQAALNGQTVQLSLEPWEEKHWDDFIPGVDETSTKIFFTGFHGEQKIFFRIKPKTISINGIEVPAPMNQTLKEGIEFFYLDDSNPDGYNSGVHDNSYSNKFKYGWWDSEEKIKLVVEALRKAFEVQS